MKGGGKISVRNKSKILKFLIPLILGSIVIVLPLAMVLVAALGGAAEESENGDECYPLYITGEISKSNKATLDVTGGVTAKGIKSQISENKLPVKYSRKGETTGKCTWSTSQTATAQTVYKVLTKAGYSKEVACAVIGNMWQESGLTPTRSQSGGPGWGLVQWTKGSGRYNNFISYCSKHGLDKDTAKAQAQYVAVELKTESTFIALIKRKGYTAESFAKLKNISTAVDLFETCFERCDPNAANRENRMKGANWAYEMIAKGKAGAVNIDMTGTVDTGATVDVPSEHKDEKGAKAYEINFSGTVNGETAYTSGTFIVTSEKSYVDTEGTVGAESGEGVALWKGGKYAFPFARGSTVTITSPYGQRICPFHGPELHAGIDFAMPMGTPVYSIGSGKVTYAGSMGGYGLTVKVMHSKGVESRYSHMSKISVKNGQTVREGTKVGEVGSTGSSTGAHLDFGILVNGTHTNPAPAIGIENKRGTIKVK